MPSIWSARLMNPAAPTDRERVIQLNPAIRHIMHGLLLAVLLCILPHTVRAQEQPLDVFVSLPPQASIVQRIGGAHVRVGVLVKPGQDPHTFEPTPRQVLSLGRARIFFTSGLPFETRIVEKIRHTDALTVADTTAGIAPLHLADHHHDDHPSESDHTEPNESDPHIWLAPANLLIMAKNMHQAFCRVDPGHKADYDANLDQLNREITELDRRITLLLAPYHGQSFFVFHPAFGYFAQAYGLKQQAVETAGKSPSPKQLAALIGQARNAGVKIIFVQPQFDKKSAATIARSIGGAVVAMDPLAPDILKGLGDMARTIEESFRTMGKKP